jgi:hypothetical protein
MSRQEIQLYDQIKDLLEANLRPIRDEIKSINKGLLGNGQPGLFQRVDTIEKAKSYALGGWKMASLLAGAFIAILTLLLRIAGVVKW